MIDITKVENALIGLVGYEQPADPDFFTLDSTNLQSDSGYKINRNPYAKLESLKDTQDYSGIDQDQFNTLLTNLNKNAIGSVVNAVFRNKKTPSFIDRQLLYKHAQNKVEVDTVPDGFVCHRIKVEKKNNIAVEISRVLLDFQGTGDITLLLYSTTSLAPIFSETVTVTSDHQEVVLNWKLDNTSGITGGDYYIGYYNQALTLQPYKREYEQSNIESIVTHVWQEERLIPNHAGPNLWDLDDFDAIDEATGLNLDITVYNDYTDLVIQNKYLFDYAIYLEAGMEFLNYYKSSIRSNKNQRISEQKLIDIQTTIEGQKGTGVVTVTGLRPALGEQINLIQQSILELTIGYFTDRLKTVTLS